MRDMPQYTTRIPKTAISKWLDRCDASSYAFCFREIIKRLFLDGDRTRLYAMVLSDDGNKICLIAPKARAGKRIRPTKTKEMA